MKLSNVEKDKKPQEELLRLFEKTRVAYLSAIHDPKEYGSRWRRVVEMIQESYDELDIAGRELKEFIKEDEIEDKEVKDPTSNKARNLYQKIKEVRYISKVIADPFSKSFGDGVLEELLTNPESMLKFVHYAIRDDDKVLSEDILSIKDMKPDTITEGLVGLDLEVDDVALYVIEHYGDGKDSKKVEKKVKAALDMLELLYFSRHEEKEWSDLKEIEGMSSIKEKEKKSIETKIKKEEKKSEEEKAVSDFIIPNKPMYRIFEIEDINELKGFSGNWYIQEKYDGMRIQLHKIDNNVKIFSYNEKNITSKCKEIVDALKEKQFGDCILDAELILFDGDEALHRADTIAHVFKDKYKDAKLKCHVFDIMRHENRSLLDEELEMRMTTLFNNYSAKSSEYLNFPSKKDTREADTLKDLKEYAEKIMDMPTSEGVVIKDKTSTYYIGTKKNPKWIKMKKFVDLDVIVLDKKKTKSNLYSYSVGVGPVLEEMDGLVEIDKRKYLNVGKALNTKTSVDIGDIIRVKVDEVKKKGEGYSLFSAKVIEIPEVEYPDKLVTLELLSQDTKKSLNYNVEAFTKGVKITDHIHGETTAIMKFDTDGFVIYGFEENNLMSKNALMDIDMWKSQAEEVMKTKQGELTVHILNFLKEKGDKTPKEVHNYLKSKHADLYEQVLDSKESKLGTWAQEREHISMAGKKLHGDDSILAKDSIIKQYKTPEEYQKGEFKIYSREDDNIHFSLSLGDETLHWTIDTANEEELFDLFGAAGKYPAEPSKNVQRGKVIDSGEVELGVQRDDYHEYFLKGNKFETKLHLRVIPVKGEKMWLAWTGYKQKPADKDGDEGKWNFYENKFSKLSIPR